DNTAANPAKTAAAKNGTLDPYSAKNPPIPGPIINPVLIAADIYPNAFERVSNVVISAIYAVTAGIMNAALIPPKNRDTNKISTDVPIPNKYSEKQIGRASCRERV